MRGIPEATSTGAEGNLAVQPTFSRNIPSSSFRLLENQLTKSLLRHILLELP